MSLSENKSNTENPLEYLSEAKTTLFREINNVLDEISNKRYEVERKIDDLYRLKDLFCKLENKLNGLGKEIETIKFDEEFNNHNPLLKKVKNDLDDLKQENDDLIISLNKNTSKSSRISTFKKGSKILTVIQDSGRRNK